MSSTYLSLIPRISEKTFGQSQNNIYVFNVPLTANKQQIAAAVTDQYKVTVEDVNIMIAKGKAVRTARKRAQPTKGYRRDVKKAYVRLAQGDSIKIFDEVEEKK